MEYVGKEMYCYSSTCTYEMKVLVKIKGLLLFDNALYNVTEGAFEVILASSFHDTNMHFLKLSADYP